MVSDALIARTKRHEGLLLTPKPDAKGMYAVGYGHDISEDEVDRHSPVTLDWAQTTLQEDLEHAEYACTRSFSWWDDIPPLRQEVLTEMVFQMGMDGVSRFRRMLMALSIQDYAQAATQMLLSDWDIQTPARCEELARIMKTGVEDGNS